MGNFLGCNNVIDRAPPKKKPILLTTNKRRNDKLKTVSKNFRNQFIVDIIKRNGTKIFDKNRLGNFGNQSNISFLARMRKGTSVKKNKKLQKKGDPQASYSKIDRIPHSCHQYWDFSSGHRSKSAIDLSLGDWSNERLSIYVSKDRKIIR